MAEVWHVLSENQYGLVFSKYYTSESWAIRKVQQLRRDNSNSTTSLRVLRGNWETIDV